MSTSTVTRDICPAEHAGWLTTPFRRLLTNPRRVLGGLAGPGDVVADLGCGPGFFTLPLAEAVGDGGTVVAVDVQPAMLDMARKSAESRGLLDRIRFVECGADSLGLEEAGTLDATLAFYMIHEVPDAGRLFGEVFGALRPGGRLLAVEPWGHVNGPAWAATLHHAAKVGFTVVGRPRIAFSRAALLERPR